jgi:hypothetical protein
MAAIVTDQFRLSNADNFINSVENSSNSYYVFTGLANPSAIGFGRSTTWNSNVPNPIDNVDYINHYHNEILFGQNINSSNIRRVIRKVTWAIGNRYEMYRHDYSIFKPSPITNSYRLYDANYYVISSNYNVYICIDNGSNGTNITGNVSQDEPTFTDLEPSPAGASGDGYLWKYLFTVSPSDIIKFDSIQYITVPDNWNSSADAQIAVVRNNGNSTINNNQIKKVYIENGGFGYGGGLGQSFNILGDGSGGVVSIDVVNSTIINVTVTSGGSGYTYGLIDLGSINSGATISAKLIPIIPPSLGHGYDLYKELGTEKVLVYARFDDSTKDYPTDTSYAQVGILKNPQNFGSQVGSGSTFTGSKFSGLYSIKFLNGYTGNISVGDIITQTVANGTARGYVASFDTQTNVLKYFIDRSFQYNPINLDQTDYIGISSEGKVLNFESSSNIINSNGGFSGSIDVNFSGITTNPTGNNLINLGVNFTNGIANPDINKLSGDIIYIDNRPLISRNPRQKEDVKIILEF